MRENLRGLYPNAEVPVPRDSDKRRGGLRGKMMTKMTKQTYRDFVDIIRFARGPPDLPEKHADFPFPYARIQSLASEPRLDIHLTVLPSRIVLRAMTDFIKHSSFNSD